MTDSVLKKIEEYAVHMDWEMAFEGRSKGNRHLFRVEKLSRFLHKAEGGDIDIIIAGAWLHDIGLVEGNKGHCFKGAIIASQFLEGLEIDRETISRITHCIEAHDGEIEAETTEAKIVHDADTVDKMGPLGAIRHAWKMANVDYHSYTVDELLEFLPEHLAERRDNLYLESSVALADRYQPVMENFFKQKEIAHNIISKVMDSARQGVPSDVIVERLLDKGELSEDFLEALGEQSKLDFL